MKNKLLNLIICLIISLPALSQTNPRLVNQNYMRTVLFDDFLETQLNNQWRFETYKRSLGVLSNDSRTHRVLSGNLELKMIYSPNYSYEGYTGDYVGSEIITNSAFRYGSFECRAKFAYQNGSWPAFWILGGDDVPCIQGGKGNEIDIAELKCEDSNLTIDHVIHYYYAPLQCDGEQQYIHYSGMNFDNNFHLFKCIWTPDIVTYYIDGVQTHQVINSGQQWFPSRALEVRLSQQIIDPLGAVITPQTSYFDYVRVKQFFLSPEITVPSYICSTGIATLDVDPLATHISWQITPTNLVASPSGTGLTTNITLLPAASGIGTITYSFSMPSGETFTARKEIQVGLKASFTGNTTVLVGGSGTWTATATCGVSPFNYEWFLREDDGSGAGPILISTGNPLILWSVPRSLSAAGFEQSDSLNRQPLTKTIYYLSVRASDTNGRVFITPEKQVIA